MTYDVSGKVVLITGPARGIGAESARQLAKRGARLALVGLEPERLAALTATLGTGHVWVECDVTDQAALTRAVAHTANALGGIDVVIANAGVATNGTVAVTPVDALARVIEVNLIGVVRTVSTTLPYVTARRGYYLLVSSAAAIAAMPGISTYAASKAGVEFFGTALRAEIAHTGVRVGVAHPSWIDTDMVRDQRRDLHSFNQMLRSLPGPLGSVTSVETCASAFVRGIERRARKIYVPRTLAPIAAVRQLLASPFSDWVIARQSATMLPKLEYELAALGRPFGVNSTGFGERGRSTAAVDTDDSRPVS